VLSSQLGQLRGIERHAIQVLGRHMEPLYVRQITEAKAAAEQKDSQLKEMEERIRQQEEALTSEDEEMLCVPLPAHLSTLPSIPPSRWVAWPTTLQPESGPHILILDCTLLLLTSNIAP